jgi:hypothetical protein
MLVFVVVKKVRDGLRIFSADAFLPGCAMAGAKAHSFSYRHCGTTKVVPCYKTHASNSCKNAMEKCSHCIPLNGLDKLKFVFFELKPTALARTH